MRENSEKKVFKGILVGFLGVLFIIAIFVGASNVDTYNKLRLEQQNLIQNYQSNQDKLIKDIVKLKAKMNVVSTPVVDQVVVSEKPILSEVVQRVMPGVVHVMCPRWQGSGFVVAPNIICTARHVVEGVKDFIITTNDDHKLRATRAISSRNHDIGFIYIDDLICVSEKEHEIECNKITHKVKLQILELGSIKDCVLGQDVFAIGSPFGKINFNNLTSGIVSGLDRNWEERNFYTNKPYGWEIAWVTSAVGHPGNSGCPVFTYDGKVRGVLVGGFSPVLICCMPVDLFLKDLLEIESMFIRDKYQFEKLPDYRLDEMYRWYQNKLRDNRFDEMYEWFKNVTEVY